MILKDRFDNEIKPGVRVTFPVRTGSFLSMVDGHVLSVEEHVPTYTWEYPDFTVWIRRPDGKKTFTRMIERLTVVAGKE